MKRLVIITGASQGIGAALAIEANQRFKENTLFLLIARNLENLEKVKESMLKEKLQDCPIKNKVLTLSYDFSVDCQVDQLLDVLKSSLQLEKEKLNNLNELYVFYNHGTLKLGNIEEVADSISNEFQINVVSVWSLLAALKKLFPHSQVPTQFHINLSSLWASKSQELCSVYCATRSAREKIFKCLALEQSFLKVLNYQPGPVYSDMQKKIFDSEIQVYDRYKDDYMEGKFLTGETTSKRLFDILEKNQFETGSTIDYFDDLS